MSEQSAIAVTGATVQELIMQFPIPLALLGLDGKPIVLNGRFEQVFDNQVLSNEVIEDAVHHPGLPWRLARVTRRDGTVVDAQVQAISLRGHVVVVVDEALDTGALSEVHELNARIVELERLSATDHLTGTWNRAHLDRVVESEVGRSLGQRQPVSLILFDIDHFKLINDTYGHLAGDQVLCELVQLVRTQVRVSDMLFRWGGEEFVVLVASAGYRNAATLAETVRSSVARHSFAVIGATLRLSLGVAEYCDREGTQRWFRRLDKALYTAKSTGRDRVVVDRRGNSDVWAAETGLSALRLTWLEGYECGEPTIDAQHRDLFDMANALIDASFLRDSAPRRFDAALTGLLRHIKCHFADEEALLERHAYARLGGHREAHARLLERIGQLEAAAQTDRLSLGKLVDLLANDIVARHLLTADRDFFELFRKATPVAPDSAVLPLGT